MLFIRQLYCLKRFFAQQFPRFTVVPLEATYLVWIDCASLGWPSTQTAAILLEKEKLRINEGVMLAQRYVSSSLTAIIASSTAIWIMAFDAPMWKKNFRNPPVVIGITTGFLGVVALYVEQLHPVAPDVHSEYGVLILLFGCISWPLGTLYTKYRSSGEEDVNAFAGSAWQMIFAGAVFWVVSLINGDVFHTNWGAVPPSAWRSLSYLIVFGSILAYSAYIWLLKIRSATEVGTHAYVNPFIAVFIGMYFGNEQVTTLQLAGLAVILFSVLLINRRPRR